MRILWQNSKKCSTVKQTLPLLALFLLSPFLATAAISSSHSLSEKIKKDLVQRKKNLSFLSLTDQWENAYGTKAFQPLLELAKDQTLEDSQRYIALLSAQKLGGKLQGIHFLPFLNDSSWMMRSAALKTLKISSERKLGADILPLLFDPALLVRLQAIDTLSVLKPKETTSKLILVLKRDENYSEGKPVWVPQKAIKVLEMTSQKKDLKSLKELLSHSKIQKNVVLKNRLTLLIHKLSV